MGSANVTSGAGKTHRVASFVPFATAHLACMGAQPAGHLDETEAVASFHPQRSEVLDVSATDKAKNAAQAAKGKVKEVAGRVADDEQLENEGRADQVKSDLKQAGEKVKDALND
jgi:uncharacterized protein YjbJ (UPF0337 family)